MLGGNGSLQGASLLSEETQIPLIGVPKTIDNDVGGTEYSLGFDTAVNTAVEAVDKIRDTATSHDRLFLVVLPPPGTREGAAQTIELRYGE